MAKKKPIAVEKTHTGTLHAWLSSYNRIEGLFDQPSEVIVDILTYSKTGPGADSYFQKEGYTYIGTAEITVKIPAPKVIVQNKVASLKSQKTAILAKAQAEATAVARQIQNLLAIEFDAD